MNASKRKLGSDLAKVDAHVIQPEEYDEIPELTDDMLERADLVRNGVVIKRGRGRPAGSNKSPVNLRLDQDVIDAYKSEGSGWQTRMNEALRDYAKSHGML